MHTMIVYEKRLFVRQLKIGSFCLRQSQFEHSREKMNLGLWWGLNVELERGERGHPVRRKRIKLREKETVSL